MIVIHIYLVYTSSLFKAKLRQWKENKLYILYFLLTYSPGLNIAGEEYRLERYKSNYDYLNIDIENIFCRFKLI
jgi:hypothetical protein